MAMDSFWNHVVPSNV